MAEGQNTKRPTPAGLIEEILSDKRPKTARELVQSAIARDPRHSEEEILDVIEELTRNGGVTLQPPRFKSFRSFFIKIHWNATFLMVVVLCLVYTMLYMAPIGFPWSLLRIPPGLALLFYLPGHNILRI